MKTVQIWVKTNKIGSDSCAGDTGYTRDEWDNLPEDERNEIIQEIAWQAIEVWEKD